MTPGPHAVVKRELLVRYLDAWVPAALHGSRRATYLDGYASGDSAEAALGVIGEFTDLLARHALSVVLAAADGAGLAALITEVAAVRERVPIPAGVTVQLVPRPADGRPPVLSAPAGAPLLAFLDATTAPDEPPPDADAVGRLLAGGRAEALLVVDPATLADRARPSDAARPTDAAHPRRVEALRQALRGAGDGLVTCVELVSGDGRAELVFFATPSAQRLEVFKDALWAVDEYAGVRYRDPRDPDHALLDISLTPHPGPLRRALLAHLDETGERTVAELRRYALTDTAYRAADVARALTPMLSTGAVRRTPTKGRLTAEAVISVA